MPTKRLWTEAVVGRDVRLVSVTPGERQVFTGLRPASIDDIGGILQLIEPLEAEVLPPSRGDRKRTAEVKRDLATELLALSDADLDVLKDIAFGTCTNCRRCTLNCPMGVDTAVLNRLLLEDAYPKFLGAGAPIGGLYMLAWSSVDPAIASIDATGRLTGVSAGIATITASSGSATGTALVTVK